MPIPVITFAAYSGVGKTTYLERLLPCLKARGLRTAVIKHDGHEFEMDTPGTDTYRLARSGADTVAILSGGKFALLEQRSLHLEDALRHIHDADLILTEGFKHGPYPKIALFRSGSGKPLAADPRDCLAVVSDVPLNTVCPLFPLDDPQPLADYLIKFLAEKGGLSHGDHG